MTGVSQERLDAHERLLGAVADAVAGGERVPCVGKSDWWDAEHPELQEAAVHGCRACDQLDACRTYVTEYPERAGIWAALTPPQQKRLHRKEHPR